MCANFLFSLIENFATHVAATGGIAKGGPGWACARPIYIPCLYKMLGMPCDWEK